MLNTEEIKQFLSKSFDLIGICPAITPRGLSRFNSWLESGYAGEMDYLPDRRDAYAHPEHVMEGVKSIVMLGSKYALRSGHPRDQTASDSSGRIARYALTGNDYHDVIHKRLKQAKNHFSSLDPHARFRGVVDTAPLLEREFAQLAGLGWQGKNTMLISKTDGSWFFLSALLTDLELDYDTPFESQHCGTCTACLDACPTDAFVEPHVLDATRCISYWNIEVQDLPAEDIRSKIGNWVFGCDICQEVCPWNRKSNAYLNEANELAGPLTGWSIDEMLQILQLDDQEFRQRFRKTPFWRGKRRGLLRNILLVLTNLRAEDSLERIEHLLLNDSDSLIRATAAWSIGRLRTQEWKKTLLKAMKNEPNSLVLDEIARVLNS